MPRAVLDGLIRGPHPTHGVHGPWPPAAPRNLLPKTGDTSEAKSDRIHLSSYIHDACMVAWTWG